MSTVPTVLLVDDEEPVLWVMKRALDGEGYNVLIASNGNDALTIARSLVGQLRLVVIDVWMPQMGGVELAGHLARLIPTLPVLFITGDIGADVPTPLLAKPFAPDELTVIVRRMLDAPGIPSPSGPTEAPAL